ncbi:DUF1003 domain-containing protein [Chryseobacterium sp.]|uniref:DUF1003 domain-containing protein n=1 Tax=Chryseobacterium sp. TaxID=1871047 RepID=UPI0011C7BB66|nr:DUF1003 domain-containing protein [Chryseobacterium sp.]TXF79372.1 DUF1003 domain-containing protein [Chryseobacterium sp.]
MKSEKYILDLLKSEDDQLNKIHNIVHKAIEEESLLITKLNEDENDGRTFGEKLSDNVAKFGGSWKFIILFALVMFLWIFYNTQIKQNSGFDPYPYILLNLILSCIAAVQAPIIMMSQNRQEFKDRKRSKNDYMVNLKSEIEIRNLHEKLDLSIIDQYKHMCEMQQKQIEILETISKKLSEIEKSRNNGGHNQK